MSKIKILWTDDEIEVLRPHIIFLGEKGYDVHTCSNGNDTIDLVSANNYDIIFLDENMPGLSGIDTLREIKKLKPSIPVVMITKSEAEDIMDVAIGSEIADFLIKPVKPSQILLSLKKNIEGSRLVTETTTVDYQSEFGKIRSLISMAGNYSDWIDIYRNMVYWETRLDSANDKNLEEIFHMQQQEANSEFARFVANSYLEWLSPGCKDKPLFSNRLMEKKVFPLLEAKSSVLFILIDNLRYDQWKIIASELNEHVNISSENLYFSILPTATQYSRNAIFAGLMPAEIEKMMPQYWVNDDEDKGKNLYEDKLLEANLKRNRLDCRWEYYKAGSNTEGKKINDKINGILKNDLTVLVYNFIDMLSHARTEIGLIRDLADNESAYRSVTRSWFRHSPLFELIKMLRGQNIRIILTSDHGTIKVSNPLKVIGDRHSSTNIRYKLGRNLDYPENRVFEIKDPARAQLPMTNISSRYIFAKAYDYLVYPKNYNHFANYYRNTFQHGGISLNEMIIPVISMEPLS